jgi:hypothetical protein
MMAFIDVGGDGSVKWAVDVDHVRPGSVKNNGKGPRGHQQGGIDEVDAGRFFTIYVEVPATDAARTALSGAMQSAATSLTTLPPGSGAKVSFSLPIESGNEDQIRIEWTSTP